MKTLSLNGAWTLFQEGEAQPIPAEVPGQVHLDLLRAGLIADPYYRTNELAQQWVGERAWRYQRSFTVPGSFLGRQRLYLRFDGLDTLTTIFLNGVEIGRTDNMFRTWEFDIAGQLQEGENSLAVRFAAPLPYARQRQAARPLPNWGVGVHKLPGGNWLRKSQCNFGWDWGPQLTTCGIWRDVTLVAYDVARLASLQILQEHDTAAVRLRCQIEAERVEQVPLRAALTLRDQGAIVGREEIRLDGRSGRALLVVEKPRLWWPNGMGDQPLYDLEVDLMDEGGRRLDRVQKRIGLRTLRLQREPDPWGESFRFSVNGVPFFAKGANWIPADVFPARVDRAWYRRLLESAAAANMNMLRVWGGGIYEDDAFYDLCDELGLCVWQDFMFACAAYPTFDPDFLETVQAEAEDNVRRLRHHACLALWCGNNELEQGLVGDDWSLLTMSWADYRPLFDELLPQIVSRLDPQTGYWPASPHSPLGERADWNNPRWGDAHIWEVWHGMEPFDYYRSSNHRFVSEFGFQSFPGPQTVANYTRPADRNITSYVMEHHQRHPSGNQNIMHYLLDWFRLPTSFEMTLWLSQILQGLSVQMAVEHWRRIMPRNMGALYWQLNDTWPVASWSSLDYYGRWKTLHYMARRFYAPLLLSAVAGEQPGTARVHVSHDGQEASTGQLHWRLLTTSGDEVAADSLEVALPANGSDQVAKLAFAEALAAQGPRELLLDLLLQPARGAPVDSLLYWAPPKHLELVDPRIEFEVLAGADAGSLRVRLHAARPALWTWFLPANREDRPANNFFHLLPGRPRTVTVHTPAPRDLEDFRAGLRLYSLYDTYH